jgi:hypothetical protein
LFNGFKGKDDPAMDFVDLLPYGEDLRSQNNKISDRTRSAIKLILESQSLPHDIKGILSMLIVV